MKIRQMILGGTSIFKQDRNLILSIYLLALLFRVFITIFMAWDRGLHFESARIAQYIAEGYGYSWDWYGKIPVQPTVTFPPLYTYFIAFFLALFNDPARYIYFAQAIINSLGVIPCYYLGIHLMDRKTGLVCGLLYALYPEIAYTVTKMVAEAIAIPLIAYSIYLYLIYKSRLSDSGSTRYFALTGIILGIGALLKANTALVFGAGVLGLLVSRIKRSSAIFSILIMTFAFILIILPWSIRSSKVYDRPVFLRSMYGYNLWRGNHPGATGTARLSDTLHSESNLDPEYLLYIDQNIPQEEKYVDQFYKNEAIRFIKNDIGRFVKLSLKRILYFITIDPTHPLTKNPVYWGGYIFILFFGIWGAIILARDKQLDSIFVILPLLFIIFYSPVMILPRYRLANILILLILSSVSIRKVLNRITIFKHLPEDHGSP